MPPEVAKEIQELKNRISILEKNKIDLLTNPLLVKFLNENVKFPPIIYADTIDQNQSNANIISAINDLYGSDLKQGSMVILRPTTGLSPIVKILFRTTQLVGNQEQTTSIIIGFNVSPLI